MALHQAPVSAVELIDRAGLQAVETQDGIPGYLRTISPSGCAILVETRALQQVELDRQIAIILDTVQPIQAEIPIHFTTIPSEYELLWKIRKGMFPSIGAIRETGTTVIIEDVAFPLERLAEATLDLRQILNKWGYPTAVIFGHALEGNLHFVFTQNFGLQSEIERYRNLMTDVVSLVVSKYDGNETCATDELCATCCPVKIDTGKLIKSLRAEAVSSAQKRAVWVADRMSGVTATVSMALTTLGFFHSILGTTLMKMLTHGLRTISGNRIPLWNPYIPLGAKQIDVNLTFKSTADRKVVYFPSCINRAMGVSREHKGEKQ